MIERIVVRDSNIFFDLLSVDLLDVFFLLPCESATTDFVMSEMFNPGELEQKEKYVRLKQLNVKISPLLNWWKSRAYI